MLECTSSAKRFPPNTVNEKEFLSNICIFSFIFLSFYLFFSYFNTKYFKLIYFSILYFKTNSPSHSCLLSQTFLSTWQVVPGKKSKNKAKTQMQLKNDAKMGTFTTNNITKIDKYKKKLNSTSTTDHKTEHNCTLVSQTINIHKSNKGVIKLKSPHKKD